ncbi:MAG TPA: response regulator [Polyangia bacterium]|jgi:two-component system response regulator RegA|nr:response regulator [Polyangia bacterium]
MNPTSSAPRNILIVDDDSCVRSSLAQSFRDAGWTVRTAERCVQAAALAGLAAPSYLIVEQRLADGSGFDLLARVRATNPNVIAIVLTRYPSVAAAVHAIRMGFQDYIAKPVEARRIAALLGAVPGVGCAEEAANDVFASDDEPASLARVEWEHIHTVLLDCRGNISEAARVLGLHRRSLQRKLRRLGPPLESAGRAR